MTTTTATTTHLPENPTVLPLDRFAVHVDDNEAQQLDQIVALVREVLGPDVIGVYLHGSAVLGELRPFSDIDLLALSRRHTNPEQKRRLVDRLLAISGRDDPVAPSRAIELTIVVESEVRPWRYPPSFDFQYGEWLRPEFERGNVQPWKTTTNPDLASLITMVLLANEPLFGPPPADVLDPVPPSDYINAIISGIDPLVRDLDSDTRNVLLTLARIWSTVTTGVIRSKDAAADWAVARLPEEHQAVLDRARAIYLGDEEERWDDIQPQVRPYADYVVREVERVAANAATRANPLVADSS